MNPVPKNPIPWDKQIHNPESRTLPYNRDILRHPVPYDKMMSRAQVRNKNNLMRH